MTSSAVADAAAGPGSARRIVILVGAPGAGKGTQAERLAARLGIPHVSTGELFRSAVRDGSALGDSVREILGRGGLVPDSVTMDVVRARLAQADATGGAILDGFPRTRAQAEAFDDLLAADGERVAVALYIEVSHDQLVRRLSGRRVCTADDQHVYHLIGRPPLKEDICDIVSAALEQRKDDQPDTVNARLDQQMPPMFDVIDHYTDAGKLVAVDGERAMDDVTDELAQAVAKATQNG